MPTDSYVAIILINYGTNCLFIAIKLALYLPAFPGICRYWWDGYHHVHEP